MHSFVMNVLATIDFKIVEGGGGGEVFKVSISYLQVNSIYNTQVA